MSVFQLRLNEYMCQLTKINFSIKTYMILRKLLHSINNVRTCYVSTYLNSRYQIFVVHIDLDCHETFFPENAIIGVEIIVLLQLVIMRKIYLLQVSLESLDGKVLAVDASILLNQAIKGMKDQPNAHLHVLFLRICKLLMYRIKPIFVFDGSVPILKRQTIAARQKRRENASAEAQSIYYIFQFYWFQGFF